MGAVHKYNQVIFKLLPRQSTRITHTHLLPPQPKTSTVPLPNPSSSPTRRFNDVLRILTTPRLACTPYPTFFERLLAQTTARGIFRTWGDLIKEFTNVAREVTRKFKS